MELSNRKTKIIVELLKQTDFITGKYLTDILGVTTRTVRSEIASLNKELLSLSIQVESSPGKGYFISKKSKDKISLLIDKDVKHRIPILPESRIDFIIQELLYNPKGVLDSQISNQLYISESTSKRDFEKVNVFLKEYNLTLYRNKNSGYIITGDESQIREFYFKYFSKTGVILNDNKHTLSLYRETEELILNIMKEIELEMSGNEFRSIVLFTTIHQFRYLNGYRIITDFPSMNVDEKIIRLLAKVFDQIILPDKEQNYLSNFITSLFGDSNENVELIHHIEKAVSEVEETFDYKLSKEVVSQLLKLILKKKHVDLREYKDEDFKLEYPFAFEMAMFFIQLLKKEDIVMSKQLRTHIIFEFVCDVEENLQEKESKTQNVVVLSQSGSLSKKYISTKLQKHFSNFTVMGHFPLHELDRAIKLNPYLIISTKAVNVDNIPVIVIDPLFKDYDIIRINTAVRKIELKEELNFDFSNLFKESLFIKEIEASSPYEVIKVLWEKMAKKGLSNEQLLEAVYARESISSTAIGNLVAIPHTIGSKTQENVVSIGILKKPMKWNTDKVQIVFLMHIQNTTDGRVKKIFDSFFDIVHSSSKVNSLIKSENFYEFIKNITL